MILSSLILLAMQSGGLETSIAEAAALGEKQNFQGAVQLLKDAGVEESKDVAAWNAYGMWSMRLTESGIASGQIGGLDAIDSWNDVAWIFESAAKLNDAPDHTWVNLSEALLNASDIKNSLRSCEDGLQVHDKSALLLLQKGRVLMAKARASFEMGDEKDGKQSYANAEQAFRKAMDVGPEFAAPCMRLAELQWTLLAEGGDPALREKAINNWKLAAEREPSGVDGGLITAWMGFESIAVFDILVEKQPDQVLHYWYRGSAYYAAGPDYWSNIRDDFQKVLELNPGFTNAYYFLANGAMSRGTQLSGQGDQETAEKAYSAAGKYWALYLKDFGGDYFNQQKAAGALDNAATNMNWLAGKVRNPEHMIILLRFATNANPDFGDAWNNLALIYRDTGQAEPSRDAYEKALALNPTDPQLMNDYAVIYHYYLKTEDDLVRDLYKKAIKRAQEMLENGEVAEADMDRIKTALRDAKNNLKKLDAGDRKNG
ncbi:MAG: tetratricopeptide repeat protein [Planctomycetota bacterium]|jgi:tetratricopeptide (TPR) repeat protein|nr:tetratricopeptide repeat protein [Planctomycetota bacterium]